MNSSQKRPYAPTSVDKQIQHERKEQRKHWNAQHWKDWMIDEDDVSVEGEEDLPEEKKAS